MKKIFKWTLQITDHQTVMMPTGAKILSVQKQYRDPQIWALCDPNAPLEPRDIEIYGTGHPTPDDPGEYISTFQLMDGNLVFHAFESKSRHRG